MGRTKGTYTLTSNIEPKVGAPLDARTIVKLLADLTASNTFEYPYKGMKVFVEENNKSYTLVGSDPTVSANWIEDNSGGHTIKNPAGTAMTQRSNLQFVDLTVSDDSINDITKVESVHVIQSESELENLPDGLYMLNDDEDTVIDGNLVGYDNTNSDLNAENVQDAIDEVVDALDDKIDISTKGVANGVAELDSTGKVPSSQLPSFVDDVIEVADYNHLPATGETGKIYVTLDTNKTYRWGGTEYVEISESLALGETSSTAYRGDRGKIAYDHSQLTSGNPHNVTKSDIGLGNVDNTSDSTKKTNFTGSIASGNTGFVTGGDAYTALGGKSDKVSSATNGNLAGLNGSGNLTDSGWNGAKNTTSISGNPISISGLKSNQLAINPIITLEPIQAGSGTPSPSNIRAISGYDKIEVLSCGKNLFDINKVLVGTVSNGLWTWGGSTSKLFDLKFKANTQYTFSGYETQSGASKNVRPRIVYTDGTVENMFLIADTARTAFTKTSAANKTIDYIQAYWGSDSNAVVTIENFQIEEGTSATTYESYHKTTDLSESLEQTVYGMTYYPRTGKSSNTLKIEDIGNLNWTRERTTDYTRYYATISDIKQATTRTLKMWFSCYECIYDGRSWQDIVPGQAYSSMNVVYIHDDRFSSAADFKTALTGQKIVYPIATPTEIQLTPHEISLLSNYAYVSTNGTSIALDYHNGELASLGDVSQLGETVNNVLNNPSILDVTSKFVANSDNVYSTTLKAFKMGRIIFITGTFHPKALSTFQNKSWFAITDDSLLPVNTVNTVATFTPVETAVSSTVAFPIDVNNTLKEIRTANNGAYGGVTNITTSSLVVCTMMYICKG